MRLCCMAYRNELKCYTSVKFAQQGGPISDKLEGLSYSAKSIKKDKCYRIFKNKKKVISTKVFMGIKVVNFGKKSSFQLCSPFSRHRVMIKIFHGLKRQLRFEAIA